MLPHLLGGSTTASIPISDGWNLLSLPRRVTDRRTSTLFPSALSHAFGYSATGYVIWDTIELGGGFWLKFPGSDLVSISGAGIGPDSLFVVPGWNMIGAGSVPVSVSSITSNPPGMTTSSFFSYSNGYSVAPTLIPGRGYWVRVNQAGYLLFSAGPSASKTALIHIEPTTELPPSPPDEKSTLIADLPKEFTLAQNYPNPFNPSSRIQYSLPIDCRVVLTVSNILGQVVAILVNGVESAGSKQVLWNAMNYSSGVYFYRLEATSVADPSKTYTSVRKMVLMK